MDIANKQTQKQSLDIVTLVKSALSQFHLWQQNYQTRRQLARLPEHLFQDVGLSKNQVDAECRRPFWR
ncbi:MAG TPA: hypothetical protein DCS35_18875 [Vibrio sp.]|nr:hypothetical protein [Vibrio sp.]